MLTYTMDIEPSSLWLRTTPGAAALAQPYFCTEAGLFLGRKAFSTARTHKDSYIIFYTISGQGIVRQEDSEVRVKKGEALLMNCRTSQSYMTDPDVRQWHHYWIHTDGAGVAALADIINPDQKIGAFGLPDSTRDLFDEILRFLPDETVDSALSISLTVHRILTRMADASLRPQSEKAGSNKKRIQLTVNYIRSHYNEEIAVSDLSEIANMSRSYYLRLFRQYIGTTPYNYLLGFRITQAKELLELSDTPVTQIAEQTGFSDESSFSTRFSAMTGVSPSVYRKNSITRADGD